jgi:hypothetical protein
LKTTHFRKINATYYNEQKLVMKTKTYARNYQKKYYYSGTVLPVVRVYSYSSVSTAAGSLLTDD